MNEKHTPVFSVIVPVYNVENYLKECVDSVLCQTFTDYELILIDDGSTDKSGKICEEYADKYENVRLISKENGGLSSARNCGIKSAEGEFLLFLDSDDFWCSRDCLKILKAASEESPDFIMFKMNKYFDGVTEDSYGDYDLDLINKGNPTDIFLYMVKENKQLACACNKAIKRDHIIKNGIFFREGITGEDIDWVVRLFAPSEKITAVNDVLYMYRQNRRGSITNVVSSKKLANLFTTISGVSDEYKNNDGQFGNAVKSFMAFEYAILLYTYPLCDTSISLTKIKEYKWLFKYAADKKAKVIKAIYKTFGFPVAKRLIRLVRKMR